MDPRPPIVHLLLTDQYLVVANQGPPISYDQLIALCRLGVTTKTSQVEREITGAEDAEATLTLIRQTAMTQYKDNPEHLAKAISIEEALSERMRGYVVKELLQNANDAVMPSATGGQGIGFSSVLTATDLPRIHSGHLSFGFNPTLTREGLGREGLLGDDGKVPVIRFPFPVERDREPDRIAMLCQMYTTTVILPLRDRTARDLVATEWDRMVHDISIVSFLPAVRSIIWDRDDPTERVRRLCRIADDGTVEIEDIGTFASPEPMTIRQARP